MKNCTCPHEEWHFSLMLYVHINVLTSLFVGEVQYIYHCPLWPHRELISRTCFLNTLFEVQGSKGRLNIPFCHCQSTHAQNTLVMGIVQSKKINKNKTLYNSRHDCSSYLVSTRLLQHHAANHRFFPLPLKSWKVCDIQIMGLFWIIFDARKLRHPNEMIHQWSPNMDLLTVKMNQPASAVKPKGERGWACCVTVRKLSAEGHADINPVGFRVIKLFLVIWSW